jgi:hypothetical protein
MVIVKKSTLETFEPGEVLAANRHLILDFSEEGLEESDYAIVSMPDQPVFDTRYHSIAVGEVAENDGVYTSDWVLSPLEVSASVRLEHIAEKRFEVETQGININGVMVPTDRHTQQVLTAMYVRAMANENYTVNFKADNGFVTLTAPEIIYIGDVVSDHIQAAFQREQELTALVEAGELVSGADW